MNFVHDLTSVKRLKANRHLAQLYLTGNPCTSFAHYREYVLNHLPQLMELDGTKITRTERILAMQKAEEIDKEVERDSAAAVEREARRVAKLQAKKDKKPGFDGSWYCDTQVCETADLEGGVWRFTHAACTHVHVCRARIRPGRSPRLWRLGARMNQKTRSANTSADVNPFCVPCLPSLPYPPPLSLSQLNIKRSPVPTHALTHPLTSQELDPEEEAAFWKEEEEFTPESRYDTAIRAKKQREAQEAKKAGKKLDKKKKLRKRRYFKEDGKPLNMNDSGLQFELQGQLENGVPLVLDLYLYK